MCEFTEDNTPLTVRYTFEFEDGHSESHDVLLDNQTIEIIEAQPNECPSWTQLTFNQCPNCPLSGDTHEHCPAALAVSNLSMHFGHRESYTPVNVRVETGRRTISTQVALQSALFSLLGLRMATSGCPVLGKLRPMARFHLPFADAAETGYRAIAMYLVSQFVRQRNGLSADFSLKELRQIYEDVHQVNLAFARRMSAVDTADANMNSLTTLDLFAQEVPFSINNALACLQDVFSPYLTDRS